MTPKFVWACLPALGVAALPGAPAAVAAENGALGATSRASISLRLVVPYRFSVAAVQSATPDGIAGIGPGHDGRVCVRNNFPGPYSVRITSPSGRYALVTASPGGASPGGASPGGACRSGKVMALRALAGSPSPEAPPFPAATIAVTFAPD